MRNVTPQIKQVEYRKISNKGGNSIDKIDRLENLIVMELPQQIIMDRIQKINNKKDNSIDKIGRIQKT